MGVPAITPRNDSTPSFTVDDVLAYERTHPFSATRLTAVGKTTVIKVLLITSSEAGQRMGG